MEQISDALDGYTVIVTKSTVPVGTGRKVEELIRERRPDAEFDIASNPEFLREGSAINDFMRPDRVVVGTDSDRAREVLREIYRPLFLMETPVLFASLETAELTKYAANAMLATKISFINEMAIIAEKLGADINMVRNGIGSDRRIGYKFIYPSVGYGGSCFPKDIKSIINFSNDVGYDPRILGAVDGVNKKQKEYFFDKIITRFDNNIKGMQFGIWGLSFKPGTDDMRESASIYIVKQLINKGASVKVYDPKAMDNAKNNYFSKLDNLEYCDCKYDVADQSDALILITEWPEFRSPDFQLIKNKLNSSIIFDGRNQFDASLMKKIGFEYHQIGKRA